jgi:general stress protein CsbA
MENGKRLWIAMVVLCAVARVLPHPWNFTPLMAIGLFSGYQASKAATGILVTLSALALSDAVLGFHSGFWFVYAAALVAVLFGRITRNRGGAGAIALAALGSSLSFFLITNFMVWATSGMYPRTLTGLAACFTAAIPFFQNQFAGDAVYTLALFGGYALLKRSLHPVHQAA